MEFKDRYFVSIKHDNICDNCKERIKKGEQCNILLEESDGGPYLKIICVECESEVGIDEQIA